MVKTKTIQYFDEGGIKIVETEVSDPGPGHVQIECAACGICALDQFAYKHGAKPMGFEPPRGHEGVGYVTQVGPDVRGLKKGDRVAAGSFQQIENVPASNAWPIPDNDMPDELWIVEPVSCCVTGVDTANLMAGDRVALIGCGFMGLILVQCFAHALVSRLVGIDINPARLDLAKKFGADAVYNASNDGLRDHMDELRSLNFDMVMDTTGAQVGMDLAVDLVRTGGRLSFFGWHHEARTISGNDWQLGGYTVVNPSPFGRMRNTFPAAIRLMEKGIVNLKPLVTHVVTLDEYPDFMKQLAAGEIDGYIKGVVKMN